jgi:ribokinase
MSKNVNITVVGSYAVGMTMRSLRFPVSGETILGSDFQVLHGGKGSNQAVEAARLGADVNYIGCIGKDTFGEMAKNLFKVEGINYSNIKISEKYNTGVGFVMVDENGHNRIIIDFGANNDILKEDIYKLESIIKETNIVLVQLEICLEAVEAVLEIAHKNKVKTILNPAPFQPINERLLKYVDILTPNESEARLLLGYKPDEKITDEEVGKKLLEKGVKNVVITLGSKGAMIISKNEITVIPVKEVKVVDTTGAGDTFSSALAVGLAEGKNMKDAVNFAGTAAALSVTKYGVVPSLPYRKEVEEFLRVR